jgi:hypothetical protein
VPENYGSSYFDRLWENGSRKKRYYMMYKKLSEESWALPLDESSAATD